jgi:hypothetical protein
VGESWMTTTDIFVSSEGCGTSRYGRGVRLTVLMMCDAYIEALVYGC